MRTLSVLLLGVLGCSDDGPAADPYQCMAAGGVACFELPTDVISAVDATGTATAPVLDCGPYEIVQGGAIAFSGRVVDVQNADMGLDGVRIEGFGDLALTGLLIDVTSGAEGAWSATAGVPSLAFARTTAAGQLPLSFLYARVDVNVATQDMFDLQSATKAQVSSMLERVGDRYLPGKAQLAAGAVDCSGNKLVNVIGNIAPASGKNGSRLFEPGVRTYYGLTRTPPVFGRRTEVMQTTANGLIAFTNISAGRHYVQLWGYPTENALALGSAGLKLLDEKEILVPDSEGAILMPLNGRL